VGLFNHYDHQARFEVRYPRRIHTAVQVGPQAETPPPSATSTALTACSKPPSYTYTHTLRTRTRHREGVERSGVQMHRAFLTTEEDEGIPFHRVRYFKIWDRMVCSGGLPGHRA
jgi:hypothetical protein